MFIGTTGGPRPAKGATGSAGRAVFADSGRFGRSGRRPGLSRWALAAGPPAGRPHPGHPRYTPLVLGGLALCAVAAALALVLARRGRRGDPETADAIPPAPPSGSGPAETPEPLGDPGAPASGPSPGEAPRPRRVAPEPPIRGGVEERVRARVGEDPRTRDLPPPNIWVDDRMAWIDGVVPSPEARKALTEVVGGIEGVDIVVNRVLVRSP